MRTMNLDESERVHLIIDPSVFAHLLTLDPRKFIVVIRDLGRLSKTHYPFYVSRTFYDFVMDEKADVRDIGLVLEFFKSGTLNKISDIKSAVGRLKSLLNIIPESNLYYSSPEKLKQLFEGLEGYNELRNLYPDAITPIDLLLEDYYTSKGTLREIEVGILIDEVSFILEHSEIIAKTKTLVKLLKKYFILGYEIVVNGETRQLIIRTLDKKAKETAKNIKEHANKVAKKIMKYHHEMKRYTRIIGKGLDLISRVVKNFCDWGIIEISGVQILIIPLLVKVLDP